MQDACLLFDGRAALAKVKGEPLSGADVNSSIVKLLANGTAKQQRALAAAHASLPPEDLAASFQAARRTIPAGDVFALFSPYLAAKVDEKKKQRDPAWARREALCTAIAGPIRLYFRKDAEDEPPLDPRWLDVAAGLGRLDLVGSLVRPGHAATNRFLTQQFDAVLNNAKSFYAIYEVVAAMVRASHPKAADSFIAGVEKHVGKTGGLKSCHWSLNMIPEFPREALPRLEALVPKLPDRDADAFLEQLQILRQKT